MQEKHTRTATHAHALDVILLNVTHQKGTRTFGHKKHIEIQAKKATLLPKFPKWLCSGTPNFIHSLTWIRFSQHDDCILASDIHPAVCRALAISETTNI